MKYDKRGVSADKTDVHNAIKNIDKGLFKNAFCKVLPDYLCHDDNFVNLMHADTAGTKTVLAYLYWKESNDISVWKGIVQDAIVMNIDDLACTGVTDNFILSSTIGRNKMLVGGDVIAELINGTVDFIELLKKFNINIHLAGGETADVGDVVRTLDFGVTVTARIPKSKVITILPEPGDVIVGLSSSGKAIYESEYNSGIGSNGLTFARHELLSKYYAEKYPESYESSLEKEVVYSGHYLLNHSSEVHDFSIGKLLLSPTRTYLPVIKKLLEETDIELHGIVHCTGGGQTKVLHFIDKLKIIKDNLLPIPPIFKLLQAESNTSWSEIFKVFNCGHRLEFYCPEKSADAIIKIANEFNIDAQVIGRVESSDKKTLEIHHQGEVLAYN